MRNRNWRSAVTTLHSEKFAGLAGDALSFVFVDRDCSSRDAARKNNTYGIISILLTAFLVSKFAKLEG